MDAVSVVEELISCRRRQCRLLTPSALFFQRAIHSNVGRLAELARGQVRVKSKGRVREYFLMLHR
jgi:hypothetical protein